MKHKEFIEQAKKEFNPDENNDSVLGKYVLAFAKAMSNSLDIEKENKKWDKRMNDWLEQKLNQTVENYREEVKLEEKPNVAIANDRIKQKNKEYFQ